MLTDNVSKYPPLNYLNFEEDRNELLCAERIYGTTKSVYNSLHITVIFFFFFIQVDQRKESSKKMTSVLCQDITINTLIRLNKILSSVKI